MKKIIPFLIALLVITSSTIVYAGFSDVPNDASYKDALDRICALGIMNGTGNDTFNPNAPVTREQFAIIMVRASGLEDEASSLKGSAVFPDVSPSSYISGYIAEVVNKGFITGMSDGKFYPKSNISFAQVCTAVVKALGYTDQDVSGLWPKNYIDKAASLGLTYGFNLKSNDNVPRWAAAVTIDRLLTTKVNGSDMTFAEKTGLFTECLILENSQVSDKLAENQVLTDKGILYFDNANMDLELGKTYRVYIDGETIKKVFNIMKDYELISVDNIINEKITYKDGNKVKSKTLTDKTVYYYKGEIQSFNNLKNIIQVRSSIVLAYNSEKTGYDYAVIYDPVYSNPEIARSFDPSAKSIGSIDLSGNPTVIKDGELSDVVAIEEKDVVYQVSDIWNNYRYILVTDSRVGGKITAILPDKVTPRTLQIDNVDYEISEDFNFNKLNYTPGSFDVDDYVVALLGYDGKIVDLEYPGGEDNSDFAFVLSIDTKITTNSDGTLTSTHYADVLTTDGFVVTYNVGSKASHLKGKLVKLTKTGSDTATLEEVPYNFPKNIVIDKIERFINESYVANNVKIFNIVSDDTGKDVEVNLIDFEDLPSGSIPDGKVYFLNKTGPFEDVNVILTNDILNEKYKTAVVKDVKYSSSGRTYSYNYTLLIDGKEYQYTKGHINDAEVGAVLDVKMYSGNIDSVVKTRKPEIASDSVQAFDSKRIKINDKVYWFSNNITVYFVDYSGNISVKSIADLDVNLLYGKISLYLDDSANNSGKVEVIVVKQ